MEHIAPHGHLGISYSDHGPAHAPAILFLNSIGATRDMWDAQVAALSGRFRVICTDARGHGASSVPAGGYTVDDLGRDAVAVLDAADLARAHVCGLSLGGLTAMWLGVHAAGRVDRLVLANTAARIGTTASWTDRMQLVRDRGMAGVADLALPRWLSEEYRERHPDTARRLRAMIERCPPEGYLGCCAALRDADLREAISTIGSPVLAIAGARDTTTPPSALAEIAGRIAGARMVTLDGAHLTNVEQADAFTAALLEFLAA